MKEDEHVDTCWSLLNKSFDVAGTFLFFLFFSSTAFIEVKVVRHLFSFLR